MLHSSLQLLTWTQELDYDGYIEEWNKLGTSLGSDARLAGRKGAAGRGAGKRREEEGMVGQIKGIDDSSMLFDYGLGAY